MLSLPWHLHGRFRAWGGQCLGEAVGTPTLPVPSSDGQRETRSLPGDQLLSFPAATGRAQSWWQLLLAHLGGNIFQGVARAQASEGVPVWWRVACCSPPSPETSLSAQRISPSESQGNGSMSDCEAICVFILSSTIHFKSLSYY